MSTDPPRARPGNSRFARVGAFVLALPIALLAPRVYGQMRVAVVNIQQAILETDQGRNARNQLRTLFTQRQQELDGRQQALSRLREDLEKQRASTDRATLARRMEDYQKQFVDLQQNYTDYQQELARREAELTKQIYTNLQGVVRQVGERDHYSAIFEQSGIVWATQGYDMTESVVRQYNRDFPAAAAPAAATPDAGAPVNSAAGADAGGARDAARVIANPHPRGEPSGPTQ